MITPSQIPNPYVKPRWQAPVGVMESVVMHNCRKYGMPLPVLAMPMWEGAGNRAIDLSGHSNHGTIDGAAWVADGLDFGGSDYINAGSAKVGSATKGITVSTMVYTGSANFDGGVQAIVADNAGDPNNENGFFLIVDDRGGGDPTNGVRFDVDTVIGNVRAEWVVNGIVDIGWYHIIALYNPSIGQIKIYINGEEKTTVVDKTGTGNYIPDTDENLYLGALNNGSANFIGKINATTIYNLPLTAAQVKFLSDNPYFMYQVPEELYGYAVAVGGVSPTSVFYGPLVGPFGGPL